MMRRRSVMVGLWDTPPIEDHKFWAYHMDRLSPHHLPESGALPWLGTVGGCWSAESCEMAGASTDRGIQGIRGHGSSA